MAGVSAMKFMDRTAIAGKAWFLSLFRRKRALPKDPHRILLVQMWGIGESILTLPAISHLRKHFPKSTIHVLCTERNEDVYFRNKDIDRVVSISASPLSTGLYSLTRRGEEKYDLVIDFEEYLNVSALIAVFVGRSTIGYSHGVRARLYDATVKYDDKQHVVRTFEELLKPLGIEEHAKELPVLRFTKKEEEDARKIIGKHPHLNGSFVVIVPGSAESSPCRMWPWRKFAQLVKRIEEDMKVGVALVGTRQQRELCDMIVGASGGPAVNLAGQLSVRQLFALIGKSSLVVSNDTGPMHIGAAMKTPTLGLFGPNLPVRFGPFGDMNRSIYKARACSLSPCINVHKGQTPDCLYRKSSKDYQKCMKAITVQDVMKEINPMLKA